MDPLVPVDVRDDIFHSYRDTPVGHLLACHNLGAPLEPSERAELLIGTCMDHRIRLRIPENFAYVLRTGGGNLRDRAFEISFAVGMGGVGAIAVIGHSDCGMAEVASHERDFVQGLVENGGWDADRATEQFRKKAQERQIGNPVEFAVSQARQLRDRYPEVLVAPLHYRVGDARLYQVRE